MQDNLILGTINQANPGQTKTSLLMEEQINTTNLAEDILAQRCVLLIGPELFRCGGQPVLETLRQHLWTQHRRHFADFYEREGLFKFTDDTAKKRALTGAIPDFFKTAAPDDEAVLKKLLAIPFHLVLQVSPDTFLSDAAHRFSVKHQFKFFSGGGKTPDPVDSPNASTPLFYNLCGTKDRFDSMILDFDDLYNFLKAVFAPPGLPQNLRTALDGATTFLFLGFQLDKWYTQLLMRWVSDVAGAERVVNHFVWSEHNRDMGRFLEKHLRVVTTEGRDQFQLLDEIFENIPPTRRRPLADPASPNTVSIRREVQNGNLEKALHFFNEIADSVGERDASALFLSEFSNHKTAYAEYALNQEQYFSKNQNLSFRLLETIKKFEQTL